LQSCVILAKKGVFKSNLKITKFNPKSNLKHVYIIKRALTYNTCFAQAIKKDNRVLNG
jgi:hypothetical protein